MIVKDPFPTWIESCQFFDDVFGIAPQAKQTIICFQSGSKSWSASTLSLVAFPPTSMALPSAELPRSERACSGSGNSAALRHTFLQPKKPAGSIKK